MRICLSRNSSPILRSDVRSYLGNVVADIIHQVHVKVVRCRSEHLGKGLAYQEGHGGAIHPGEVGSTGHGFQIVLALLGVDACTGQLPVIGVNLVTCHGSLHCCQSISSNLHAGFLDVHLDVHKPTHTDLCKEACDYKLVVFAQTHEHRPCVGFCKVFCSKSGCEVVNLPTYSARYAQVRNVFAVLTGQQVTALSLQICARWILWEGTLASVPCDLEATAQLQAPPAASAGSFCQSRSMRDGA